jgi:hypothetical protein
MHKQRSRAGRIQVATIFCATIALLPIPDKTTLPPQL